MTISTSNPKPVEVSSSGIPEATEASTSFPSSKRRTAILWILFIAYTLNFLDRQVVSILAEPIKTELHLADWQIGLMSGLAFGVLYTLLGLPLARLAESVNRKWILGGSLVLWSAFTFACGSVQNFVQLVAARIGVGVGEAGFTPTSHSLIADITPKEKRASALAFFATGQPAGVLAGMIMGGLIANFYGWRASFLFAGIGGLIMAPVLSLVLVEPRTINPEVAPRITGPHFVKTMKYLASKRTYWRITLAGAINSFIGYGNSLFIAAFFLRTHHRELAEYAGYLNLKPIGFLGLVLGLTAGTAGIISSLLGGVIADYAAKRDVRDCLNVPAIAAVISPLLITVALLLQNLVSALVVQAAATLLGSIYYGANYSLLQGLVPQTMRTISASTYMFSVNLIGLGLGPLTIGALSDFLAAHADLGSGGGIRWALIISSYLGLFSALLFLAARRSVRDELVS